jgi:hypothetical protein
VRHPGEARFRKIDLTDEKVKKVIADAPNTVDLLLEMGWVKEAESLELPSSTTWPYKVHIFDIIEARDYYKTQAQKERSHQVRASKDADGDTSELGKQIETDHEGKAVEGPVTTVSKAQKAG